MKAHSHRENKYFKDLSKYFMIPSYCSKGKFILLGSKMYYEFLDKFRFIAVLARRMQYNCGYTARTY